jgi:hypothetical protein
MRRAMKLQPGTPSAILPFNKNYPKNRLGLAQVDVRQTRIR